MNKSSKLLLLAALLSKDNTISNNGKGFLKGEMPSKRPRFGSSRNSAVRALSLAAELILRKDERILALLDVFEEQGEGDTTFLDSINEIIGEFGSCVPETRSNSPDKSCRL